MSTIPVNNADDFFSDLYTHVLKDGHYKNNRTGVNTYSTFGNIARFNLSGGKIPLPSTKKLFWEKAFREMLWFISGDTNIRYLKEHDIDIWDSWLIEGTECFRAFNSASERAKKLLSKEAYHKFIVDTSDHVRTLTKGNAAAPGNDSDIEAYLNKKLDELSLPTHTLEAGDIGSGGYGAQWRNWVDTRVVPRSTCAPYIEQGYKVVGSTDVYNGHAGSYNILERKIDQLQNAIDLLKKDPDSRRIIVSAWNPAKIWEAALPPCHFFFQFYTRHKLAVEIITDVKNHGVRDEFIKLLLEKFDIRDFHEFVAKYDENFSSLNSGVDAFLKEKGIASRMLSCMLNCRSQDTAIGTPFNIAQYSLLTHMVAHLVGMDAEEFIWVGADTHIYENQIPGINEQLSRDAYDHNNPKLTFKRKVENINDFTFDDFEVSAYYCKPYIKMPVAV